jgi:serine/threonine-protein kinase HSL1 (negative regulator of Swe1 kinase)
MLEGSEGLSILRCRLEDVRDPSGVMGVLKAVKFRVEVLGHRDDNIDMVSLTLIHEKGSIETFKEIYRRLERDWSLGIADSLASREVVGTPISPIDGRSVVVW